jgi:hypothetical protein
MKVGILTHPLKTNYGGILQNYALQVVLSKLGHDVITINIGKKFDTFGWLKSIVRYPVKKIIRNKTKLPITKKQTIAIEENIDKFIGKHINTTEPLIGIHKRIVDKYGFDAIIVGSDQVWRPDYVRNIGNMFLDFLGNSDVTRIAYAASFGIDEWTFSKKQEAYCSIEAKKFKAISVREESGVYLCNKYLNVNATHVLDPTMLLKKENYLSLLDTNDKVIKDNDTKQLSVYILDLNKEKNNVIDNLANKFNLKVVHLNNHNVKNSSMNYEDRIVPPIESWLKGFDEGDFIITDSFHGTLFSIIFNKPFVTLYNEKRGLTRVQSILSTLDLENQLISCDEDINSLFDLFKIDFTKSNAILREKRKESLAFIENNFN